MNEKFISSFLISIIFFTIIFIGIGKSSMIENVFSKSEIEDNTYDEIENEYNYKKEKINQKNEILFLLLGVDAEDVKDSKGTRTDTIMLSSINLDTGQVNLLSIPRDTRIAIKGKMDKINHAHSRGGVELTMKSIRDFLNLDIDYYAKVDYRVVMDLVDAIGGVEIDVPRNMQYKEYDPKAAPLDINIKKGLQVLDGKNSHDYLRWRNNNAMTRGYAMGDIGRVKAQQGFMKELIKQTLRPKNIFKLPKLVETYFKNVETNIPKSLIIKSSLSANKIDVENIKTETINGDFETIDGVSYWKYSKEETKKIVEEMFGNYTLK